MNMELRFQDAELRANEDGTLTVSGYVNKTGQLSNVLGVTKKFVEKIAQGAFSRAILSAKRDINFLAEHNNKQILASTRNGSLELREDEQGLFMSANISPTSWGRDYYQLIKDGIHRNMSFGFRTVKDSWKSIEPGLYERTIEELELFEVSVVFDPAYSQSSIDARGIDLVNEVEVPAELEEESRNMDEIKQMIESFSSKIDELSEEVREMRDLQKRSLEEAEQSQVEETATESKEQVEEGTNLDESSEEKTEDSEVKEDEEVQENQESEEQEEQVEEKDETLEDRSEEKADYTEFRNRIASLKQEAL